MRARRPLERMRFAAMLVACAAAATTSVLAPAASEAAAPELASFPLACVLAPGVLNVRGTVTATLDGNAPAGVSPGDAFSLAGSTLTLTLPPSWTLSFNSLGASFLSGAVTALPIDATNAIPVGLNAAAIGAFDRSTCSRTGPVCRSLRWPSRAAGR